LDCKYSNRAHFVLRTLNPGNYMKFIGGFGNTVENHKKYEQDTIYFYSTFELLCHGS